MNRPSRRGILGGLAALAAPANANAAYSGPDAALLEACAQYLVREAEYNAAYRRQCAAQEAGDKAEDDRMHLLQSELACAQDEPLRIVIDTPARTSAGRLAKARVAVSRVQTDLDGRALSTEDALVWSLAEDLAGKPLVPPT